MYADITWTDPLTLKTKNMTSHAVSQNATKHLRDKAPCLITRWQTMMTVVGRFVVFTVEKNWQTEQR